MADPSTSDLVRDAAGGDQGAWNQLVDRYSRLVWAVARGHRLANADSADVFQTTWLRLVEHLGRLRDPEQLAGWLSTTARHESLRVLRLGRRERPDDDIAGAVSPTTRVMPGRRRRCSPARSAHRSRPPIPGCLSAARASFASSSPNPGCRMRTWHEPSASRLAASARLAGVAWSNFAACSTSKPPLPEAGE